MGFTPAAGGGGGQPVGEGCVVGRTSCVDFSATLGDRVSIQTCVYVTGWPTPPYRWKIID